MLLYIRSCEPGNKQALHLSAPRKPGGYVGLQSQQAHRAAPGMLIAEAQEAETERVHRESESKLILRCET